MSEKSRFAFGAFLGKSIFYVILVIGGLVVGFLMLSAGLSIYFHRVDASARVRLGLPAYQDRSGISRFQEFEQAFKRSPNSLNTTNDQGDQPSTSAKQEDSGSKQ